jgi:pimeloyl-ACP methyl ester carboxylesterase
MARLWWHRTRRVLLIAAGALVALLAAGALYQSVSIRRESGRFPPPGRLVDVGGRRLHLLCIGEGQPTVVFEPSGFGNALSSSKARAEVAAVTRVCSYDRMGTGWSDPGPATISVGILADDLDRLLTQAGMPAPYVLVPSSIGGLTVELFARRHPERVAGLVYADGATSGAL